MKDHRVHTHAARYRSPTRTMAHPSRAPISLLAMFVSGVVVMIGRMFSILAVRDSAIHTVDEITAIPYSNLHHSICHSFLSCMTSAYKHSHCNLQHTWIDLRAQANTVSIIYTTYAAKDEIPSPNLLLKGKSPASRPPSRYEVTMLEGLLHGPQTAYLIGKYGHFSLFEAG